MREGIRNFMVGLTSIGALIGLAALLMSFGELDPLFNPRYRLNLKSDNAAGLRPGGAVEFNGVPVGVVDSVYIEHDPEYPVRIVCLIKHDVRFPKEVKPFASSPLIGGSSALQLVAPPESQTDATGYLPTDGSALITGPIRGGLFAQITEQLDQRMKPLSESLEKFNKLADSYIALGDNLNSLLEPQSQADIAGGEQPNLRTAVLKLNNALEEAQEGLRLAKEFLGDEQLNADARSAVKKANALIEQATNAVTRYTQLADSLKTNSEEITKRLLPVADSLGSTLEEVRRLSKLATEGQGTVGRLLNNPDLYNSLLDAAIRLERTLVEAQLLIEKMKQEGVDINF